MFLVPSLLGGASIAFMSHRVRHLQHTAIFQSVGVNSSMKEKLQVCVFSVDRDSTTSTWQLVDPISGLIANGANASVYDLQRYHLVGQTALLAQWFLVSVTRYAAIACQSCATLESLCYAGHA